MIATENHIIQTVIHRSVSSRRSADNQYSRCGRLMVDVGNQRMAMLMLMKNSGKKRIKPTDNPAADWQSIQPFGFPCASKRVAMRSGNCGQYRACNAKPIAMVTTRNAAGIFQLVMSGVPSLGVVSSQTSRRKANRKKKSQKGTGPNGTVEP